MSKSTNQPEATEAALSDDDGPAAGGIQSGKLAGRSMASAIWILAVPVLVQQTMQAFVGMTDKMLAGHLPVDERIAALDAIGVGSYVGWFINIAMAGLGIGGQAIIARAMGAGDRDAAERALGQAMGVCVAWGALVGLALWLSAGPVASMCQLAPSATELYVLYVRVVAVALPLSGVMIVGAMCLHGAGETTAPAAIAIAVNVVNVVVSWCLSGADIQFGGGAEAFILRNPFSFDFGVAGIAAGTAIGYAVGAAATLGVLARGVEDLRLRRRALRMDRALIRRIVRIGAPNFFEGISMWTVNLIVLVMIGFLAAGEAGLQGAHIIAVQWEAFSFLPGFAIGTAAGTLAGQYLGAGEPRMAERAVLVCTGIAILMMGTLGVVFMTCGTALCSLLSREPIHLEYVPRLLFIGGVVQVFFAITMVVRQGLRGVGDTAWTFLITTFSSYGIRLPAAYLFGVALGYGLEGIWYGLCGELVIRAMLFSARFFHGGWKRLEI